MNKRTFQALVIIDISLIIVAGLYDYLFGTEVSSQAIEFVASIEPEISDYSFTVLLVLAAPLFVLFIASIVGLLRFKDWGRKLYVASFGVAAILYPFLGVTVYSGMGLLFNDASSLLSGYMLAVMYLSTLSREFN